MLDMQRGTWYDGNAEIQSNSRVSIFVPVTRASALLDWPHARLNLSR
jgi:hypothetical protein